MGKLGIRSYCLLVENGVRVHYLVDYDKEKTGYFLPETRCLLPSEFEKICLKNIKLFVAIKNPDFVIEYWKSKGCADVFSYQELEKKYKREHKPISSIEQCKDMLFNIRK